MQVQNKFPPKFKDAMILNELVMSGETNTGETYSGDLLSSTFRTVYFRQCNTDNEDIT